ncbi:Bromodomain-containing protein [Hypoxylon sp. FL1150]|nr:Bromodomain-containing protein [Hypoxylon sp. FL1150]
MATEQPQSLPADEKLPTPKSDDRRTEDNESNAQPINGHKKSDEDSAKSDEKPAINGEVELQESTVDADDALNQKAFAANNNILEPTPTKSAPEPPPTTDTDMPDVNGTSPANDESPSAMQVDKDATESSTEKAPARDQDLSTQDKAPSAPEPSAGDPMDVESSADNSKLESSTSDAHNAGETVVTNDTSVATSSQDLSQPSAELSKLDIASTQPDATTSPTDTPMTDQPTSATKVAREREEDGSDERVAKRVKTEEGARETPADSSINADTSQFAQVSNERGDKDFDEQVIAGHHARAIRVHLAGLKKTKNGLNFRSSVQKLWPGLWEDYSKKISTPVDISLFEMKLREEKYANYGALKADVGLLYENSVKFNGENNPVTESARSIRDQILARLPEIYRSEEPLKLEKGKAHPTRHTEPRAAAQPRRQSQARAPATSPKPKPTPPAQATPQVAASASASAPAFAIQPNGMPQIRRDSTRGDGDRPKRPIHPPKNRDLDYASGNRKKQEPEQHFIETVLEEVKKAKHYALNQWFLAPVDPVALNIPTYFSLVKKPMDLDTMTRKYREGEYKSVKDLEKDMKLIVHNAELFNGEHHEVTQLAKRLEDLFKGEVAKKDQWMKRHYPPETPPTNISAPSPERSTHESEEESEADGDNEGSEVIRNLQGRLDEEQDKLNTLLGSKKPDITMIDIQQQVVSMLQRKLVEEKTKPHGEKKPKPKKKSGAKSKPKSGGSGTAAASSKKSAAGNAAAAKKSSSHKKAASKSRPVGLLEKAVIAEGINELDGNTLTRAVDIIKRDTGQNENDDGEMELDIDALSMDALRRLYDLIHKTNPAIRGTLEKKPEYSHSVEAEPKSKPGAPSKAKKNKPMNKHEQERKIEQLRELKAQLQRHGSGSQEPPPELEGNRPAESSEEESDSEEE